MRSKGGGITAPLLLGITLGALLGVGLYTFGYARGASYLSNDPRSCANCHVMQEHFSAWMKASHRHAAVCNDCHTPPGLVQKYATKAINGFFHSLAFTTGHFPDEIIITARNFRVTESACLKCHAEIVQGIRATREHGQDVACISCHPNVGHL